MLIYWKTFGRRSSLSDKTSRYARYAYTSPEIILTINSRKLRFLEKMNAAIDGILSGLGKAVQIVQDVDDVVRVRLPLRLNAPWR